MKRRRVTVSIVSHRQNRLANGLLDDLSRHCATDVTLILTENVRDPVPLRTHGLQCREVIVNSQVKGFGANHNAAFRRCQSDFFCVMNPDVRLTANPFPALVRSMEDRAAAVAGPLVLDPAGNPQDSARRFPTAASLMRKIVARPRGPEYAPDAGPVQVDWIAGMFMLFDAAAYREVGGFDERYFLYYEDADICRRLSASGRSVIFEPRVSIVHDAQRASRRNARMAAHHLASVIRFLAG